MIRALALACLLPFAAQAGVTLVDHGVICDISVTGEGVAPMTESGKINLIDQDRKIDLTTTRVPASLGLSFGLRMRLADGAEPFEAQIVLTHPEMSTGTTTQSWPAYLSGAGGALNVFTFEFPHELATGDWVFNVLYEGDILLRQPFTVLPEADAKDILDACKGGVLMS